jgi:hypothetical protein
MHWSAVEVAVISVLLAAVIGFGGWIAVGQMELSREIGETRVDVQGLRGELSVRVSKADESHEVTDERLRVIEDWLRWEATEGVVIKKTK